MRAQRLMPLGASRELVDEMRRVDDRLFRFGQIGHVEEATCVVAFERAHEFVALGLVEYGHAAHCLVQLRFFFFVLQANRIVKLGLQVHGQKVVFTTP